MQSSILTYWFKVRVQLRAVFRPVFNTLFLLLIVLANILVHVRAKFNALRWLLRYLSGEQNVLKDNVVFRIHHFILLLKQKHRIFVKSSREAAIVKFIPRTDVLEFLSCVELLVWGAT